MRYLLCRDGKASLFPFSPQKLQSVPVTALFRGCDIPLSPFSSEITMCPYSALPRGWESADFPETHPAPEIVGTHGAAEPENRKTPELSVLFLLDKTDAACYHKKDIFMKNNI